MDICDTLFKDKKQMWEKYLEVKNELEEAKQHIEESHEAMAQMKYEYEGRLSTKNALLKHCEEDNELLLEKCQFFEKKANAIKDTLTKECNEHQKTRLDLEETRAAEQKLLADYSDIQKELSKMKTAQQSLQCQLSEAEKELKELALTISRQCQETKKREPMIALNDTELAQKARKLSLKDSEIAFKDAELDEKAKKLALTDREIALKDRELAEKEAQITELNTQLSELKNSAREGADPPSEGQTESWWCRWGKPISKVALTAAVGFAVGACMTIDCSKK
ncbi:uncharacterized protein V6R79_016874 [Siganus canaliculatus]